jgi:hypothetical protein
VTQEAQMARRSQPQNAYDHEREGARTSGVTDLIVVALTTAPFGCTSPFISMWEAGKGSASGGSKYPLGRPTPPAPPRGCAPSRRR